MFAFFAEDSRILENQNEKTRQLLKQLTITSSISREITRFCIGVKVCESLDLALVASRVQRGHTMLKIYPNIYEVNAMPRYLQDIHHMLITYNIYSLDIVQKFLLPKAYYTLEMVLGSKDIGSAFDRLRHYTY